MLLDIWITLLWKGISLEIVNNTFEPSVPNAIDFRSVRSERPRSQGRPFIADGSEADGVEPHFGSNSLQKK